MAPGADCPNPAVSIDPAEGAVGTRSLVVDIGWVDPGGNLLASTRSITVQPAGGAVTNVTSSFTWETQGTASSPNSAAHSQGTVILPADGTELIVRAHVCALQDGCADTVATFHYQVPPLVIPSANAVTRPPTEPLLETFRVVNPGITTQTYAFAGYCDDPASVCQPSVPEITLAPGDTGVVGVNYKLAGAMMASVGLLVESESGEVSGGIIVIPSPGAGAPGMPRDRADLSLQDRGMCVTVAVGPDAAYECGDLRLVHPLPGTRVLNRLRTPVLIYNSGHARPYPIVAARIGRDPSLPRPDSLAATLTINGATVATGKWRGFPGDTARIALGFDASSRPTNVYGYHLSVTAYYPGNPPSELYSRDGRVAVVNRVSSSFGRGWWLGGLEQIVTVSDEEILWVGGDGSTRIYKLTYDGTGWAGPLFDRPDTIRPDGTGGYVRTVRGGTRVFYDAAGRQAKTVNTVGHTTRFVYATNAQTGATQLAQIVLPGGTASYSFNYTGGSPAAAAGMLAEVVAPGNAGLADSARVVRLETIGTDVDRIWDPQYRHDVPQGSSLNPSKPNVYYATTSSRISSRTNRVGVPQLFRYDMAGILTATVLPRAPGDSIRLAFRAAESQGLSTLVADSAVYTLFDGPRTDSADVTKLYLDQWESPVKVVDAHGSATTLRRGSTRLAALVTSVTFANGRQVSASYDDRGNLSSTTDWSTANSGGVLATTVYTTEPFWDHVTRVTQPEGETTRIWYNQYGQASMVQPGPDLSRRVTFDYYPVLALGAPGSYQNGMPSSVTLPDTPQNGSSSEEYTYDALGNLASVRSPRGFTTTITSDAVGRSIRVTVPIDPAKGLFQVDTTVYDVLDRTVATESHGPAMSSQGAQQLIVHHTFDGEGRLLSLTRFSGDHAAGIDSITTGWTYDAAGRPVAEIAPDSTPATAADNPRDSTVFDQAGNPVWTLTRRGDTIRTRYDALNRPLVRYHSAATYAGIAQGISLRVCTGPSAQYQINHSYPEFPNYGTCGYRVPADSSRFAYDAMGDLVRADNADALIRRAYNDNGELRSETLKIQTLARNDTTQHVYVVAYGYDLDGRRTSLTHPSQLAPGSGVTRYTFAVGTGELSTVADPLDSAFAFGYDARGEITSIRTVGGIVQGFTYNQDGLPAIYTLDVPSAGGRLTQMQYAYDARAKMLTAGDDVAARDTVLNLYSGLGQLVSTIQRAHGTGQAGLPVVESVWSQYSYDALGNGTATNTASGTTTWNDSFLGGLAFWWGGNTGSSTYRALTGRLLSSRQGTYVDAFTYDAAGNTIFQTGSDPTGNTRSDAASYYGADGRLRLVDRRNLNGPSDWQGLWEEYRYDALGRRVLVYTRHVCASSNLADCYLNLVRRTVWDGDQVFYEIQMLDSEPENDGVPTQATLIPQSRDFDTRAVTGRVLHTYGPGLDQPLSNIRMAYPGVADFATIPLWDPNGRAPYVVYGDGTRTHCVPWCLNSSWFVGWKPYGSQVNGMPALPTGQAVWMGSVMEDQRDGSGLLYRRNRYYNPQTGRFTQEDPLGLTGGINQYGFAEEDPSTYSDPFGLQVCFKGSPEEIRQLHSATETAIGATITLDKNNCITSIGRSRSERLRGLRDRLALLVSRTRVYPVHFEFSEDPNLSNQCANAQSNFCLSDYNIVVSQADDGRQFTAKFWGCVVTKPYGSQTTETYPAVIAHELLGHAWANAVGLNPYDERLGIHAENIYHAYRGEAERCGG